MNLRKKKKYLHVVLYHLQGEEQKQRTSSSRRVYFACASRPRFFAKTFLCSRVYIDRAFICCLGLNLQNGILIRSIEPGLVTELKVCPDFLQCLLAESSSGNLLGQSLHSKRGRFNLIRACLTTFDLVETVFSSGGQHGHM